MTHPTTDSGNSSKNDDDRPTANFSLRVTRETTYDDGVRTWKELTLEGCLNTGEAIPPFRISSGRFHDDSFWTEHAGFRAIVYNPKRFREGIIARSTDCTRETVYRHTGWRNDGYLSSSGFITAGGLSESRRVELESEQLKRYCREKPLSGEGIVTHLRKLSDVVNSFEKPEIIQPLLSSAFRAAIGSEPIDFSFSIFVYGQTGTYKSSLTYPFPWILWKRLYQAQLPSKLVIDCYGK